VQIVRREVPASLASAMPPDLHPVLRRVYAARHVAPQDVDCGLDRLLPVSTFASALAGARRLADARERGERVLVLGDFDADGATATALSVSCMRAMGFAEVCYLVPNRFKYGYGLSPDIAERAAEMAPDLVMTVDNGISSHAGALRCHELGIAVLVTDHHLPPAVLPTAAVIVNPNLAGEPFPSKHLAGVGVAFYVMAALARELSRRDLVSAESAQAAVAGCLDLVALGTVADMVTLDLNNRILVEQGLRRMQARRTRPGILALFAAAGRDPQMASTADLGFGVAPRLNAAGRLTDMALGIECLLAPTSAAAAPLARKLDELNRDRRALQARMLQEAADQLSVVDAVAQSEQQKYCLFDATWHEGVVGLVAGRVKDQLGRPAIAFAPAGQAGQLKGSARSVKGIHIRDVIDAVATRHPCLVTRFGGHAMAAGLTLKASHLDAFRSAFAAEMQRYAARLDRADIILTDGPLAAGELRLELADALRRGGPWGQGFPEPLFDNELEVIEQRLLKERHLKLRLCHPGERTFSDAIAFNHPRLLGLATGATARFVYRLDVNAYGARRDAQLVVEHIQCD
jgi:single-stranded-DNA-specific exonuclease